MRKALLIVLLAVLPLISFAQTSGIPQRLSIVSIETGSGDPDERIEVFNTPAEGQNHYYLSVGHLGFGDEVVQILFDPIFELFIPLGDSLSEAIETLENIQGLFNEEPGARMESQGCLAFGVPDGNLETVAITYTRFLGRMLVFSLEREGYIRSSHVSKSNFGSAVRGVKFYKKLHPKE
ncbi:MAG: hypothetical protein J6S97_06575 [Bacteroidales bacterium]|nr:hypothetical protein [Bacteroidales bacterium]MBP5520984.1 hypothetical protein [Bacteroidales bacterium]